MSLEFGAFIKTVTWLAWVKSGALLVPPFIYKTVVVFEPSVKAWIKPLTLVWSNEQKVKSKLDPSDANAEFI